MIKSSINYKIPRDTEIADEKAPSFRYTKSSSEVIRKYSLPVTFSFQLILLYLIESIALRFYQEWFVKTRVPHYPLGTAICNVFVKFLFSALVRNMLEYIEYQKRAKLSMKHIISFIACPGVMCGFHTNFLSHGLQLVTVSLYTMTKSMTPIITLGIALVCELERMSGYLILTVLILSQGLAMAEYKFAEFNVDGFFLVLFAVASRSLYWLMAQQIMQRKSQNKLCPLSPVDFMYYIQPWVLLAIIPVTLFSSEGNQIYNNMINVNWTDSQTVLITVCIIFGGALLDFYVELAGLLVISSTSSLTLCVCEIFKELCFLVPALASMRDQMCWINLIGLLMCFAGMIWYAIFQLWTIGNEENSEFIEEKEISSDNDQDKKIVVISEIVQNIA